MGVGLVYQKGGILGVQEDQTRLDAIRLRRNKSLARGAEKREREREGAAGAAPEARERREKKREKVGKRREEMKRRYMR